VHRKTSGVGVVAPDPCVDLGSLSPIDRCHDHAGNDEPVDEQQEHDRHDPRCTRDQFEVGRRQVEGDAEDDEREDGRGNGFGDRRFGVSMAYQVDGDREGYERKQQ
jgi:hypothetical protein